LKDVTLEALLLGIFSKLILYVLLIGAVISINWLITGLSIELFSLYNISIFIIFFGIDDSFILTSGENNFGSWYNSNSTGNQPNNPQGPNNPNHGSSGIIDSNRNSTNEDENYFPPETSYNRLGRHLSQEIHRVNGERISLEEENPSVKQPYSVTLGDIGISKNSVEGKQLLNFAYDYLQSPDQDKLVQRFCKAITVNNFNSSVIYNTAKLNTTNLSNIIEYKILNAITYHVPVNN
jgi:hypothetical protein